MGHRIEPSSQSLPSFKLTLRFHPRVSNSHWLLSPITAIIKSARFFVIDYFFTTMYVPVFVGEAVRGS